ncbi:Hypothetical predicted protein [Mytilus galloprovincialis]|uniref:THAP-type domain-containing protein n=1 Tax=Mytilus galloprovincialis TaxID=29158 RepID=A0A8B6BWQ3_MYTGA|nr:Hypothetical predicted protein [Mytilus galloprovincialis]
MATSVTKRSRGKQCSVYGCFNFAFLQNGVPSGIHLFHIQKAALSDKHKRDRWCSLIKRHDGRDGFSLNDNTVVCQNHFRSEDITISLARKKWSLKPGVEPTLDSKKEGENLYLNTKSTQTEWLDDQSEFTVPPAEHNYSFTMNMLEKILTTRNIQETAKLLK